MQVEKVFLKGSKTVDLLPLLPEKILVCSDG